MTPQDEEKVLFWGRKISKDVQVTLVLSADSPESSALKEFCSTLSSLVSAIAVKEKITKKHSSPAIEIGRRLRYQAVPLGLELEPFLEALALREGLSEGLPKALYDKLDEIRVPAELKLYITPQCPFCPTAVKQVVPLAFASEYVSLQVIDGLMFPESARSDGIQSAPTLIFDDFRWTGSIALEEVMDVIINRDPAGLSATTLRDMIEDGGASRVARLMIENRKIFPGIIDLLVHEKWPVRLGAMVAIEETMEHDPGLAAQVIGPVWGRFPSLDEQAKGDMIYLMGETGGLDTISRIEGAINGTSSEELRTVANEAIESIKARVTG